MPGCAAVGCNNRSEKGYTMKCFPHDKKLRQIWTNKVSRADWEPSKNSFLCHVHFEADQWTLTQSGRIKLKRNAIPSIFTVTTKRRSPKKSKKLENGEDEDIYIIEYLDDPKDRNSQRSVEKTLAIHREPQKVISRIGRPAYTRSNCRTASKVAMRDREPQDTIVTSDDNKKTTSTRMKHKNGVMLDTEHDQKSTEAMNSPSSKVKIEIASKNDLDSDITVEKNLESGELEANEKSMEKEQNDTKSDKKNGKIVCKKSSIDDTHSPKRSSTKENGKSTKNEESSNIGDAINRKRRSRYEIMKDAENSVTSSKNTTNGAIDTKPNVEKICKDIDAIRRSTFTIKLTGNEDDVTEIVEVLGTEPILKYKSSGELANSNKNVVTSIISVTNHSSIIMKNEERDLTLKSEIPDSSSNDMRNESITAINGNRRENVDFTKISIESPDDDENLTIGQKLQKKIKFQEQLIRKLTDQLTNSKELENTMSQINTRSQSKRRKMAPDFCNDDPRDDTKNVLLKDLMGKLSKSGETTKRLNASLIEQEEQTKKLQLQLRQRDNRIKELNWKLNKASKCLERAEKNANTYKRKMGSMQIMITRKKIREERDKMNESVAASNENAKRPIITVKNIERPVITDKIIGRSIITTNNVERPIITARNIEKSIIPTKNTERPIITVKNIERPVITAKNSERSNVQARAPTITTHVHQKKSSEQQNQNTEDDSVIYRTVQDIFNESTNCDDDDLSFIDNPEDFMREFAGSL